MTNLIFDTYINEAADIETAQIYAHIVTAVPLSSALHPSNLSLPNDADYAPVNVSSSVALDSGKKLWSLNPIDFVSASYNANLIGIVLVVQIGALKDPLNDLNFLYYEFINELGSPSPIEAATQIVSVSGIDTSVLLELRDYYKYTVGGINTITGPDYLDLKQMLYTKAGSADIFVGSITSSTDKTQNDTQTFYAPLNGKPLPGKTAFDDLTSTTSSATSVGVSVSPCPQSLYGSYLSTVFYGNERIHYTNLGSNEFGFNINPVNSPSSKAVFTFSFYPTLGNTVQMFIDATNASNNNGFYILLTADNKVAIYSWADNLLISSSNSFILNFWNTFVFGPSSTNSNLGYLTLNLITTSAPIPSAYNTTQFTLGGVKVGSTRTEAGYSGFVSYLARYAGLNSNLGIPTTSPIFPTTKIFNKNWKAYSPIKTIAHLGSPVELLTPTLFPPKSNLWFRSSAEDTHPRMGIVESGGANNTPKTNRSAYTLQNDFLDFGAGKAKINTLCFLFNQSSTYIYSYANNLPGIGVKVDLLCSNYLPGNILNSANINNLSLWDVYTASFPVPPGGQNGLYVTNASLLGNYKIMILDFPGIYKHYRYYRMRIRDAQDNFANELQYGILFLNSSIIYPYDRLETPDVIYVPI